MVFKKGFTLIELLAVIVILAIILLITVPLVSNLIDNIKRDAKRSSVNMIIKAAETEYSKSLVSGTNIIGKFVFNNVTGNFENGGNIINYSGEKPSSGEIVVGANGTVSIAFYDGKYCITGISGESITEKLSDGSDCKAPVLTVLSSASISNTGIGDYQKWDSFPDTPVSSNAYRYQFIAHQTSTNQTILMTFEYPTGSSAVDIGDEYNHYHNYYLNGGSWSLQSTGSYPTVNLSVFDQFYESNYDLIGADGTTVVFNKTTLDPFSQKITLKFNNSMLDPVSNLNNFSVSKRLNIDLYNYQKWSGYPNSPDSLTEYPYQLIGEASGKIYLLENANYIVNRSGSFRDRYYAPYAIRVYELINGKWVYNITSALHTLTNVLQANFDVYNGGTYTGGQYPQTTLYFSKNAFDFVTEETSVPMLIDKVELDSDNSQINLYLHKNILSTDTIKINYSSGDLSDSGGNLLDSFTNYPIVNNVNP